MSDSKLHARTDTRLKTDERLENLLKAGLASPSSPLEADWLAGMKRKLTAGLKAANQKTEVQGKSREQSSPEPIQTIPAAMHAVPPPAMRGAAGLFRSGWSDIRCPAVVV